MQELLIDKYTVSRPLPANFREPDRHLFAQELVRNIGPVYLHTLQNAYALDGVVFKPFRFYIEQSLIRSMGRKERYKRLRYLAGHMPVYEKCIWITDDWSGGYFHWLMDALPRLMICREKLDGHKVLLPGNYRPLKYISRSLELLGVEYIYYDKKCKAHELLLPDHVTVSGNYYPPAFDATRAGLLKHAVSVKPRRKIYVSRGRAKFRKLANEKPYMDLLERMGFEIHFFEEYSLEQQIQLMQETAYLVGLHGNALTNIFFMQAGTRVLELRFADDQSNNCFFSLAAAAGVHYYYQAGSGTSGDTHIADMTLDLRQAEIALRELLAP